MRLQLLNALALAASYVFAKEFDSANVKALTANNFKKTILGSEVRRAAPAKPESRAHGLHTLYSVLLLPLSTRHGVRPARQDCSFRLSLMPPIYSSGTGGHCKRLAVRAYTQSV